MTEFRVILDGETPAKKNSRITLKNGRTIPSKRYQEWHDKQMEVVLGQKDMQKIDTFFEPVEISFEFTHGDFIRRDSDNGVSSVLDLLVDCGILNDDCWKIVQKFKVQNLYEKGKPRVLVCVKTI